MALLDDNKANILFKHYLGAGSTRLSREFFEEAVKSSSIVKPDQLWKYADGIPNGIEYDESWYELHPNALRPEAVRNLTAVNPILKWNYSESVSIPLIKYQHEIPCAKIDEGTLSSFRIQRKSDNFEKLEPAKCIIPFNFAEIGSKYEDLYNYTLKTSAGTEIPFGVGDWVVDTNSGILTFYGQLPEGVSTEFPPKLTYYEYIGGVGFRQDENNYDGAFLTLSNLAFKDQCVVTNTTLDPIARKIINACDKIEKDFVKRYGWDGSDSNEGVALAFEKYVPLLYENSNDVVKGTDEAKDCEIRTLLSSKTVSEPNSNILFVSQSVPTGSLTITPEDVRTGTFGNDKTIVKIKKDSGFIVYKIPEIEITENIVITIIDTTNDQGSGSTLINCLLVYWSGTEYLPYTNKEQGNFKTGFPIVTLQGKIPPSILLDMGSIPYGEDSITPDYYGPRVAKYVIATDKTENNKSADAIVKEADGYYLDQILSTAKDKLTSGIKIVLREGSYSLSENCKELKLPSNCIFEGVGNVEIFTKPTSNGNIAIALTDNADFAILNNITFTIKSLSLTTGNFTLNNCTANTININTSGKVEVFNSSITTTLDKTNASIEDNDDIFVVDNSKVYILKATNLKNGIITSNDIGTLDIDNSSLNVAIKGKVLISNNLIKELTKISEGLFLQNNYIASISDEVKNSEYYSAIRDSSDASGRIPIYGKDDHNRLRYANTESPLKFFKANEEFELNTAADDIDFKSIDQDLVAASESPLLRILRDHTLQQKDDGRLYTWVNTNEVYIKPNTEYARTNLSSVKFSENGNLNTKSKLSSLDNVLSAIFRDKADLDDDGKIPINQIPDSIASSGLTYVGSWNFTKSSKEPYTDNKYPSYSDFKNKPEEHITKLQKGMFCIVTSGTDEPWVSNPTYPQHACNYDSVIGDRAVFTAGDWLVWSGAEGYDPTTESETDAEIILAQGGTGWEKIDRAYLDPLYSSLPSQYKDKKWWWKDNLEDGGALDLSNNNATLLDALYEINTELLSLYNTKPSKLSDLEFSYDYSDLGSFDYYTSSTDTTLKAAYYALDDSKKIGISLKSKDNNKSYSHNSFYYSDKTTITASIDDSESVSVEYSGAEAPISNFGKVLESKDAYHDQDSGKGKYKSTNIAFSYLPSQPAEGSEYFYTSNIKLSTENTQTSKNIAEPNYDTDITGSFGIYKNLDKLEDEQILVSISDASQSLLKPTIVNGNLIASIDPNVLADGYFTLNSLSISGFLPHIIPASLSFDIEAYITKTGQESQNDLVVGRLKNVTLKNTNNSFNKSIVNFNGLKIKLTDNAIACFPSVGQLGLRLTNLNIYTKRPSLTKVLQTEQVGDYTLANTPKETIRKISKGLNDNKYSPDSNGFGKAWNDEVPLTKLTREFPLQRVSRLDSIENKEVFEYRIPQGFTVSLDGIPENVGEIKGEEIDGKQYYSACFELIENAKDISGFSFKIEVAEDYKNNFKYNSLTAATEDIKLLCIVVDDNKDAKVYDCNSPCDKYIDIDAKSPENGHIAVMYAGKSDVFNKRVTFGRKTVSGKVFIKIGIPKKTDETGQIISPLSFKGIVLTEVI